MKVGWKNDMRMKVGGKEMMNKIGGKNEKRMKVG